MTMHVFGAVCTALGTAANNRGQNEGNITTLQKLLWDGEVHTTVSAESIRFALRRRLAEHEPCNRTYDEGERLNKWEDPGFARWGPKAKEKPFIDDDLLGYMSAEAAKEEAASSTKVRRAVLEVTRAVSLTPWAGDVTFNAASPGATPSAQKKGSNPVLYGTEMHATRYQYGFAMTPSKLHEPARAAIALRSLVALGEVAGNHGRFLFDFSPESIVLRLSDEPAPRLLYGFRQVSPTAVHVPEILRKVRAGDIKASELFVGGAIVERLTKEEREALAGASIHDGVRAAGEAACARIAGGKG